MYSIMTYNYLKALSSRFEKGGSMKKHFKIFVIAVVITAVIVLSLIPFGAVEIKRYYGDINNDSYVTTQDAVIALSIAVGIYDGTLTEMDFEAADINGDNLITTHDARMILRTAAGQEAKRPMEGYEFSENADKFLTSVNELRINEGIGTLKLSNDLCAVARDAAREYATETGTAFTNSDDSYYYTLLDKNGINYTFADKIVIPSTFSYKETFNELAENLQSKKALCNKHFKKFGVGAYTKDGHTFYWCIFLTD